MNDIQFIPAAAGYYALWPIDQHPGYGRTIITGWQIDASQGHVSWTHALIEGQNPHGILAILCPDGTVNAVDSGQFWPDAAAWLADVDRTELRLLNVAA